MTTNLKIRVPGGIGLKLCAAFPVMVPLAGMVSFPVGIASSPAPYRRCWKLEFTCFSSGFQCWNFRCNFRGVHTVQISCFA